MLRVTTSIPIDRPVDDVFAFVTDVDNVRLWDPKVIAAEITADGSMKEGAVVRESRRVWWGTIDATYRVIEYEPTTKFCLEGEAGGVRATSCLQLVGTGSATEMTFVGEYQGSPLFQLLRHVSRPFVQRNVTTTMRAIKQLLEEGGAT
jgi:uncharacterized protein YndB with AHSA1/START domain